MNEPLLVEVPEAQRLIGVRSVSKIYELFDLNGGPIRTRKIGRKRMVLTESLREFAKGEDTPAQAS